MLTVIKNTYSKTHLRHTFSLKKQFLTVFSKKNHRICNFGYERKEPKVPEVSAIFNVRKFRLNEPLNCEIKTDENQ